MVIYIFKAVFSILIGWLLASELIYCLPSAIYPAALMLLLSWLLAGRYLGIGEIKNKEDVER